MCGTDCKWHGRELQWSLQGTHACADLPEIGPGKQLSGYISWLLLMAVGIPIWAYQGLLGLTASIFAYAQSLSFPCCLQGRKSEGLERLYFKYHKQVCCCSLWHPCCLSAHVYNKLFFPLFYQHGEFNHVTCPYGRRDQFYARKDRSDIEYPDAPQFQHRFIRANGHRSVPRLHSSVSAML